MKKLLISIAMLVVSLAALAEPNIDTHRTVTGFPCIERIWTPEAVAQCVGEQYHWEASQKADMVVRIYNGEVEVDIFDVINAHCDVKVSIFDPYIIEKQQFFDCITPN